MTNINNKYFVLFIIGAFSMLTSLAEAKNYDKPYYTIEFSAKQIGFQIRVNDIPVFDIDDSGFMTSEVPINEYIIQNNNTIKVITFPPFNDEDEQQDNYVDGSSINLSIFVRDDSEPTEKRQLLEQVSLQPYLLYTNSNDKKTANFESPSRDKGDIEITKNSKTLTFPVYGTYKKQVEFEWDNSSLTSSFPKWEWENGVTIEDSKENYNSLIEAYKELHDAFSKKDLSRIKEISHKRSQELATSYYLGTENNGFDYSALEKYISHPRAELYKQLYTEDTKLEILANGKLARITDGAGNQPVVFVDDNTGQIHAAQFMWYKDKQNKWILIR